MNLIKPALSLNTFTSGKIYFLTTLKQVIKISLYFDHLKSQIWHTNLMFIFFDIQYGFCSVVYLNIHYAIIVLFIYAEMKGETYS